MLSLTAAVVGRYLFYDQSKFEGNTAGISASDDAAIATDKTALLSGAGTATIANLSSYSRGINGLMVDIAGAPGSMTVGDFTFKVGANNAPTSWTLAPAPSAFTVRSGALGIPTLVIQPDARA